MALRNEKQQDDEQRGGQCFCEEHAAPAFVDEDFREKTVPASGRSQRVFEQEIVYDVRCEKPYGDSELVQRYEPSAVLGWGDFTDVRRSDYGGNADADSADDAE